MIHVVTETVVIGGLTVYLLNENAALKKRMDQLEKDLQVVAQQQVRVQQTHAGAISGLMKGNQRGNFQRPNMGNAGGNGGHNQPQRMHRTPKHQPHSGHGNHNNHNSRVRFAPQAARPHHPQHHPHQQPRHRTPANHHQQRVEVMEDDGDMDDDELLASEFGDEPSFEEMQPVHDNRRTKKQVQEEWSDEDYDEQGDLDDEMGYEEEYESEEPEPEPIKPKGRQRRGGKRGQMKIPSSAPKNRASNMDDIKERAARLQRQAEADDE